MNRQQISVNLAKRVSKTLTGHNIYTIEDVRKVLLDFLNASDKVIDYKKNYTSEYYQQLHENNAAFQQNNWLMSEFDEIKKASVSTIIELACGNANFSAAIAPYCRKVYAIDWAVSPNLTNLPSSVTFLKRDIVHDDLPSADLACSADFLEHLPTDMLNATIKKIIDLAPLGYHKIACYDDGHSHLSILPPWKWLSLFQSIDPRYRAKKIEFRRDDPRQIVLVITNL